MLICKECNREFETLDSLRRHRVQKHNIKAEQTYIDYVLNGIEPTCKCGCGERTKFLGIEAGFREYKLGHGSRIHNNWGHNPEAIKKSHATQKKMYESGELIIWNKGLTIEDERVKDNINKVMSNPNRGENISKALSGVAKSEKHKNKLSEKSKIRWSNQDERLKQSELTIKRLTDNNYVKKKTKLEKTFQLMLESFGFVEGVDFKFQYQISSAIFDFYFFNYNILIEVDGDFYHCNPNTKHNIPTYPIQLKTVANDFRKNKIAENKQIRLLRFWENDIITKREEVIKILKEELGLS